MTAVSGVQPAANGPVAAQRPDPTSGSVGDGRGPDERPCRYCIAAWASFSKGEPPIRPEAQDCEWEHRDDPRVYALATAMAKVMQDRRPADYQIGYFLADANEVIDDFDPPPAKWSVRRRPQAENDSNDGIEIRLRINGVTYVGLEGGKGDRGSLVRLAEFRRWNREADQAAEERDRRRAGVAA